MSKESEIPPANLPSLSSEGASAEKIITDRDDEILTHLGKKPVLKVRVLLK
jgi:hypothetical protein